MRLFILVGTLLLSAGCFLFTRGESLHWGFMIPGTAVGLFGILVIALGLTALRKPTAHGHHRPAARRIVARAGRVHRASANA